jgi:beta-lactamase class A
MNIFPTLKRASAILVGAAVLVGAGLPACSYGGSADAGSSPAPPPHASGAARPRGPEGVDAEQLAGRFKTLSERAGGEVGVAVVHVESGRAVEFNGASPLPLFSVFKLPLAIAVLKDVEGGRLRLDQKVRVTPEDVAPGAQVNTDLWRKPSERTVTELIELSISRSDNTSSDKLLQLVGGPAGVTERMRALGLRNIEIRASVREFAAGLKVHPNTGTAADLAQLLARLQKGEVLQAPQAAVLLGAMERATTGLKRLRGDLPAGTPVADKTGTGGDGRVTNDVGLITLPDGRGRLAMAVLVSGSKLPAAEQEKLIAELARAAYDAHVAGQTP